MVKPHVEEADDDGWGVLGGAEVGTGALLLDCDGTLAETERDGHRLAFNQAFEELLSVGSWTFWKAQTASNGRKRLQMDGTQGRCRGKTSHEEKNFEVEWDAELYGELLSTGGGKERMARRGLQTFAPLVWRLKSLKFLFFFKTF